MCRLVVPLFVLVVTSTMSCSSSEVYNLSSSESDLELDDDYVCARDSSRSEISDSGSFPNSESSMSYTSEDEKSEESDSSSESSEDEEDDVCRPSFGNVDQEPLYDGAPISVFESCLFFSTHSDMDLLRRRSMNS